MDLRRDKRQNIQKKLDFGTFWNVNRFWRVCKCLKIWCRGAESNCLRPPFQGGALPVSYPGTQFI
jgi:hypothetical protein